MVGAINGAVLVVAAFLTVGGDGAADTFDNTVHTGNSGNGHRYASSSAGAGAGAGAGAFPNFPPYPMFPQFDYNRLFNDYFRQLHNYHQQLIDHPDKRGSSSVGAAGMFYDKPYRSATRPSDEFRASASIGSASRQSFGPGTAGATYGYGFGDGNQEQQRFPGAAAASAGVSFDGTAYKQHLYPNADTPNVRVENRFADPSPPGVQSYGVFVSSAGGAGVGPDGKPYRFKTATSSVNDNGNVTVYTVRDP